METVIRIAVIYLFVLVGLRFIGKREFAQLSPLELITLMLIPEIVSPALNRNDFSITNALVGVSTLFCLVFFTSVLMHMSRRMEAAIAGGPTVLVQHGKMIERNFNRERVTPEELFNEMHKTGLERLEQVRWAVMESDGKIAIIPEDSQDSGGSPTDSDIAA